MIRTIASMGATTSDSQTIRGDVPPSFDAERAESPRKTCMAEGIALERQFSYLHGLILALLVISSTPARAQISVVTRLNNNSRTGQNLQEYALTPTTVNQTQFGKLFSCPVDGYVYASPLYVANLAISGQGTHNVVFVATERDDVYAFDADNPSCSQIWYTSFINPSAGITTVPQSSVSSTDIVPEIGVTGTPVIDPSSGTLYVVAKTEENGTYVQRLHALDITTGAEKFGGPVVIQASVAGSGDGSSTVSFNPLWENQRAALLLANGVVYIAWGSHGDLGPYHGWLLGYNASTLQQVAVWNSTPNGSGGGIWQGGDGPSADSSGNIYAIPENGTFDANEGGVDFGGTFVKLSTQGGGLTLVDYFTPYNQAYLNSNNWAPGTSAPMLLPDQTGTAYPHLLLGTGKDGEAWLVNRDNMGQYNSISNSNLQTLLISQNYCLHCVNLVGPALWPDNINFLGVNNVLQDYPLSNDLLSTTPISQASTVVGFPGGTPVISANGSTDGIVWVLDNSAYSSSGPAILHAYEATNVATELWNSSQAASSRDQAGPAVKFTVPTVANSKVYVGGQYQLTAYGLFSPPPVFSLSATPSSQSVQPGGSTSFTVSSGALNGFSGSVSLSVSGLPAGASASLNPSSVAAGASSILTITTTASTPVGSPTLTITGMSGSLVDTYTVTLNVSPNFTLAAAPSSFSVNPGGAATYTVSVGALNGFTGSVSLSASGLPSGATASFSPSSVSGSGFSTLTVTTTSSTPIGSPTLTITGTSGSLVHTAPVTLVVTTSSSTSPNPISIQFVGNGTAMASSEVAGGVMALSNWNPAQGASSSTPMSLVDSTGSATTATVSWKADDTWLESIVNRPGNYRMMLGYLDNGQQDTTTVTVSGLPSSSSGYTVYVYANGDTSGSNTGIYQISGTGITTTSINLTYTSDFNGTFTQANSSVGNYVVFTIPNVSSFTLSAIPSTASSGYERAPLNGIQIVPLSNPDFAVSASPSTQTVSAGGSTTYTVNVGAVNGFTGSVSLSASGLPSGATASFSPSSVSGLGSSTLTVTTTSSTPIGSPTLTITGTSGSLVHTATVTLNVTGPPDFTLSAAPSSFSVDPGGAATYTVSVGALNGFTGSVSLSASGLPNGATASFSPSSVSGSGFSTLTVTTTSSTPIGSPTLTITGTSGSLVHTAPVTLVVTTSSSTSPNPISIQFVGNGTAMASSEVAGGVMALSNWNPAQGASSSTPMSLVDSTGSATTATVSWKADDTWLESIVNQPGNYRMMLGYLDNGQQDTTTVTVSGLPSSSSGYTVYVYANGDTSGSNTGIYQISGTGITTTSINLTYTSDFNGTFTQANSSVGNYVVFTIPNVSSFTLSAIPSTASSGYERAPLNGIQIVPLSNPDFAVSASPSTQTVSAGGSTTYTVNVGAVNGFTGSVSLSASGLPSGATASFSPSSVSGSGFSTLTVTTTSSTPIGSPTLTITGTSGSLVHTAPVTLVVTTSSSTSPNPISIQFVGNGTAMASSEVAGGVMALSNWNPAQGASSSTPMSLVDSTGSATTATVSWKADDTWLESIVNRPGNYRMMLGYLDNGQQDTTTVTVSGLPSSSSGYTVYVYANGDTSGSNTGIYQISGTGITTTSINLTYTSDFNGTFTQANSSVGNYVVFTIPNVSSFTLSAIPSTASSGYERAPLNGIQIVPN